MLRGKHLSLEEARRFGRMRQFVRETEYQVADGRAFEDTLKRMATAGLEPEPKARMGASRKRSSTDRTSGMGPSAS